MITRRLLFVLPLVLALIAPARAATLTITLSGSTIAGLTTTQTKTFTVSDADLQTLLNWQAATNAASLPPSPTPVQILLAWIQQFVTQTVQAIQNHNVQLTVPPQITIQ